MAPSERADNRDDSEGSYVYSSLDGGSDGNVGGQSGGDSEFKQLAERQGELASLRIRCPTTMDGEVVRHISKLDHILHPSYYAWHDLFLEMQEKAERLADAVLPGLLQNAMATITSIALSEQLDAHAVRARAMR
ncbi:hypothetical protein PybrP1_002347 [[Pythium] brassicae (nom. inval.)]|nr:hypothetical protein PybrP1_002347 [[Pythium] brassicae (nom. inval.)]